MLCPFLTPIDIKPTDIPNACLCLCPRTLCFLSWARAGLSSVKWSEGAVLQHTLDGAERLAGDWLAGSWSMQVFCCFKQTSNNPFFSCCFLVCCRQNAKSILDNWRFPVIEALPHSGWHRESHSFWAETQGVRCFAQRPTCLVPVGRHT